MLPFDLSFDFFLCAKSTCQLIGTYATFLYTSPLDGFSTVLALIFVLMVTSIKEAVEDIERAR